MNIRPNLYHQHRFPSEIISHCVWLYIRFSLSYRKVVVSFYMLFASEPVRESELFDRSGGKDIFNEVALIVQRSRTSTLLKSKRPNSDLIVSRSVTKRLFRAICIKIRL
jgi:hypothetical protein